MSKNYRPGTDVGSLTNYVLGSSKQPTPIVGMGATILLWSDRKAVTIVEVSPNGKRIVVQDDTATLTGGSYMSESQTYTYTPDPSAKKQAFTLRRDGSWVEEGEKLKGGTRLLVGERDAYYDPSF